MGIVKEKPMTVAHAHPVCIPCTQARRSSACGAQTNEKTFGMRNISTLFKVGCFLFLALC